MAQAEEIRGKRCISMRMNAFPRDLLNDKFMTGKNIQETPNEDENDIELSLDLSLNGHFGVDPQRANKLKRSSSITNCVYTGGDDSNNGRLLPGSSYTPIARTCSLPVEAEEECRKRKEMQSLRRLEAKRKRMEKLQNVRVVKEKVDLDLRLEENVQVVGGNNNNEGNNGNSVPLSQGSMGSQGSVSSGVSDFGTQPIQGPGERTGANTPTSIKPSEQEHERKQVDRPPETTTEKSPSTCDRSASKEAKEMLKNFMLDMPCVSTKGVGPNGRKIEGFLYRYKKGEELKIVCVCHGNFLSPAEFVKHGGGGDVANPLKHIVINPSPLLR
ncbi:ninja-family protein AFP3-like [Lycium barbarum]|uniref:ninja-family protein AFP3-like n=1 Tax=Lycium barbarum TaxID=112863 RepID=UPI00293F3844|nr:ninja-family protein AFP3-like [Lycium barbarum]